MGTCGESVRSREAEPPEEVERGSALLIVGGELFEKTQSGAIGRQCGLDRFVMNLNRMPQWKTNLRAAIISGPISYRVERDLPLTVP